LFCFHISSASEVLRLRMFMDYYTIIFNVKHRIAERIRFNSIQFSSSSVPFCSVLFSYKLSF
jgi:hypothetical protein